MEKRQLLFLQAKLAFLEEEVKQLKKSRDPFHQTRFLVLYDIPPLYPCYFDNGYHLVLVVEKNMTQADVIKVRRPVVEKIVNEDLVTLRDYVLARFGAQLRFLDGCWRWIKTSAVSIE